MKRLIQRILSLGVIAAIAAGAFFLARTYLFADPDRSRIEVVGMLEAPEVNVTSRIFLGE